MWTDHANPLQGPYPYPRARPVGVTLLGVLVFIVGLFLLLGGILVLALGSLFFFAGGGLLGGLGAVAVAVGAFILFMGVLGIAVAVGLWNLRPWARVMALIFAFLMLLSSLVSLVSGFLDGVIGLLFSLLIIGYLFTAKVKSAFGAAPYPAPAAYAPNPWYGPTAPPSMDQTTAYGTATAYCNRCGSPIGLGATQCPACGMPPF